MSHSGSSDGAGSPARLLHGVGRHRARALSFDELEELGKLGKELHGEPSSHTSWYSSPNITRSSIE